MKMWKYEFYVRYVMIVNNNKTKVQFIFVYTPDIISRAF